MLMLMIAAALALQSVGGWEIGELDDACFATAEFVADGRPSTTIDLIWDGASLQLAASNPAWSVVAGRRYPDVEYQFDDGGYTGATVGVTGGVGANLPPDALDRFASSTGLTIVKGEAVMANVSLRGSAAAASALRACTSRVAERNAARARREARWDYIARDPFADGDAETSPAIAAPVSWARSPSPSFPELAAARGLTRGRVRLSCTVEANGSLTGCSVLEESAEGVGFGQAALAAARRARVAPRVVDTLTGPLAFSVDFRAD